ncbi:hypothetical protein F5883DRAFT_716083 [Diaporthe sp. PMI_573]|nr:hypothetical protein F5883DRAFT_716083 [Diaporthaceae sp. PMI_573]
MAMLLASTFPEPRLPHQDAVSPRDSFLPPKMPSVTYMNDPEDVHRHATEEEFELYDLWLPDRCDRVLSETIAMSHDELLALTLEEMFPEKGSDANPIDLTENVAKADGLDNLSCVTLDRGSSCHCLNLPTTARNQQARPNRPSSVLPSPNLRGKKRKAFPKDSSKPSKRAKAKQSAMRQRAAALRPSARYLHEEEVFLRLEKIFVTFGRQKDSCQWNKRLGSWSSGTDKCADIRWMFKEHSDAVSVQVRPDGVGYPVELAWDGEDQCFIGTTVDEKWIEVSSETMLAMHDNPLHGPFVGSRFDWRWPGKRARNGDS